MNVNEAYDHTLTVVDEIKEAGVKVEIKPCSSRDNEDLVKKYDVPNRISSDKWIHVSFFPKGKEEIDLVFEKGRALRALNICFDSGGGCGSRDWELDWSFTIKEDASLEKESYELVEGAIQGMEESKVGEE